MVCGLGGGTGAEALASGCRLAQRRSQLEWLLETLDVQQMSGALLLLECSKEGPEAFVLCEAGEKLATPLEMQLAGPQGLLVLLEQAV